jgi:8-oxo-dGTP pyrophosphatase MutT (NUDIX family)
MMLDGYTPRSAKEAAAVARVRAEATLDRDSPLHLTGSAFIVHVPTRRVLLRWHSRMQRWLQVGGHFDPGETDPIEVALREAREETGLDDIRPLGAAPVLVVIVPVPACGDEPAHEHADVRYVFVTDQPDEASPESTDAPLRWVALEDALEEVDEEDQRTFLRRIIEQIPPTVGREKSG